MNNELITNSVYVLMGAIKLDSLNAPHEDIYAILCLLPWPLSSMPLLCCFSARFLLRCFCYYYNLYILL